MRNFKLAFRALAKRPIFALAAVLTLALGIGANTAIFSVFDAVILRPLPFRDSNRLVLVWQKRPDGRIAGVTAVNYQEWVKQATCFEQLFGVFQQYYNFRSPAASTQVIGAQVSPGFLRSLGVQPVLGHGFDDEKTSGASRMVLLSYRFWQNELGADRDVVGRSVEMNAQSFIIAGVLPREINFPVVFKNVQLWTLLDFDPSFRMRSNTLVVIGRLKPGISMPQANLEMQAVARNLESEFPDINKGWSATVAALHEYGLSDVRAALIGLLVGVALILLIACVNVANLLLARAEMRQKDVAIRSALGASRAKILSELVVENLLLALSGGLAGLGLAYAALRLLTLFDSGQLPRVDLAGLGARVLAFTLAVTVLTALLFGLFPARQLLTSDLNQTLRQSSRGTIQGGMGRRSRNWLVVSQVALSLVLVAGAGLMIRSLLYLQTGSRGFVPEHLLSFRVSFTGSDLSNDKRMAAYYVEMLDRIQHLPGVEAVAATTNVPLDGYLLLGEHFRIEGAAPTPLSERPAAACGLINAGYFKAIGTPLLQGREFDEHDREGAPPVALISATVSRRFFSNENPIGRKIVVPTPGKPAIDVVREIVGVVGDIRYLTRTADDSAEIYLPYLQTVWPVSYIMVRTQGAPRALAPSVRAALNDSGFKQPIAEVQSMSERIADLNGKPRLNTVLAAIFSAIALALMAIGIYGVISYSTAQRSQEIGVRMALGATGSNIVKWIVGQAILLSMAGVIVGLAGHFALSRVLGSLLYGISANDAATLVSVIALLNLIAILASYIPARRAARGDPMAALRAE